VRIVIEKYPYEEQALLNTLPEKSLSHFQPSFYTDRNGVKRVVVNTVGYCFVPELNDCVFFLPKVVLKSQESSHIENDDSQEEDTIEYYGDDDEDEVMAGDAVFGRYHPEDLLNDKSLLNKPEYEFMYRLSVWIYRAIHEFKRLNPFSKIVNAEYGAILIDKSQDEKDYTFIDVLLSLMKFNEDNQDFFMFVVKNVHSGYNKINWRKTIATKQPVIQDESPIYMNPVNRKKKINFDEELLIIYFSILNYINQRFGFPVKINLNYELITGEMFKHYLNGYGIIRLKQIKYKYFSDKALELWNLCSLFFEKNETISSSTYKQDYMLANSFQTVFEAIIDDLIGEKSMPRKLKKQKDRKIVDHLYKYGDLVHPYKPGENQIYYIGDSKYYKIGAPIEESSIYKQYTYAKNVIQYDFDLIFGKETNGTPIGYVDKLTEGYNITPNFFISAKLGEFSETSDESNSYDFEETLPTIHMTIKDGRVVKSHHMNKQFKNRLFDRDTLWISHFDISFQTLLLLYARGNDFEKRSFKEEARIIFRQEVIKTLMDHYDFYKLEPIKGNNLEDLVERNFRALIGKIYQPNGCSYLILALQNDEEEKEENDNLLSFIDTVFIRSSLDDLK